MRIKKDSDKERGVSAEAVWHILMFLQHRYGFDAKGFLAARAIEPSALKIKNAKVKGGYLSELFEEATLFTGDKNLSFKLGEWANPHSLGVLGYLLLHSNNVGDALRRLCRYYPLVGRSLKPVLSETKNRYKLGFFIKGENGFEHLGKYQSEIHLSAVLSLLGKIATRQIMPEYATFRHGEPSDISEYRRIFGQKLYFLEEENAVIFSKESLEIETVYKDPSMLKIFEDEAQKSLGLNFHGGFKEEITGFILAGVGELDFSLEGAAKRAGLHPRVLQKRLKGEGASFAGLLGDVRKSLATHYLSNGVEGSAVAVILGYSELSPFLRAFKKWYGMSPKEWLSANNG